MEEELPTLEECVGYLMAKQEETDFQLEQMQAAFNELYLDYQALFMVMRSSGRFSKDAYRKFRQMLSRQQQEEVDASQQETDGESPEGDDRG